METEKRRVSNHGRGLPGGRPRVAHYFPDTEGMSETEETSIKLGRLRDLAQELGYNSLFDVALAEARHSPEEKQRFIDEGGLEELYCRFRSYKRKNPTVTTQANEQNQKIDEDICEMSRRVYIREWKLIMGDNALKNGLMKGDSPDDFSQSYFSELYSQMESLAPQLFTLINLLIPDINKRNQVTGNDENDKENTDVEIIDLTVDEDSTPLQSKRKTRQRKENRIVVAMCILTYTANIKSNFLQRWISQLLHTYQVPKKMLILLHELGICTSYGHILPKRKISGTATLPEPPQINPPPESGPLEETQQNTQSASSIIAKHFKRTNTAIPSNTLPVRKTPMLHQYPRQLMTPVNATEHTIAKNASRPSWGKPPSLPIPIIPTSTILTTHEAPSITDRWNPPKRIRISDPCPVPTIKVPQPTPITPFRKLDVRSISEPRPTLVNPRFLAKDFDVSASKKIPTTFPYGPSSS